MRSIFSRAASFAAMAGIVLTGLALAQPALAQFRQEIRNDMARCRGEGPAIRVNVTGIESASGNVRVQLYRGIESDWLESGRWLYRIEVPARAGAMTFCLPVPEAGTYAVAVRHDVNGDGETNLTSDGGAMSNNPSINILNLGRPSVRRTRFEVGNAVAAITVNMRYM